MGGFVGQSYNPGTKKADFLIALVGLIAGANTTLKQAIPANDDDPLNIAYFQGSFIVPGDILANFIQATFSLSNAQMIALFNAAAPSSNIINYNYTNLAAAYPIATTIDAQTQTSDLVLMTPLKTKQAIIAYLITLPKTPPSQANQPWNNNGEVQIS